MAFTMDRDPWTWGIIDVREFFMSRHAGQATAEMLTATSLAY
jgi:hypothetical protein